MTLPVVRMNTLLSDVIDESNFVLPTKLATAFHVSIDEVSSMTGLPNASLKRIERYRSLKVQSKLKDTISIINMILPWSNSVLQAYAWYRSEPIPAFGNVTAESIVKMGQAEAVKEYIQGISVGGYA